MPAKISHPESASRLISFEGLEFGKIYPTDIDAAVEFGRNLCVLIEAKRYESNRKIGQERALTSLCDNATRGGMPTFALLAKHSSEGSEPIVLAECYVFREYKGAGFGEAGDWYDYEYHSRPTVRERLDSLHSRYVTDNHWMERTYCSKCERLFINAT